MMLYMILIVFLLYIILIVMISPLLFISSYIRTIHDFAAWQPFLLTSFVPIFSLLLRATCFTCAFYFLFVSPNAWTTHDIHAFSSCPYSLTLYITE